MYFVEKLKFASGQLILHTRWHMSEVIQMGKWSGLGKSRKRKIKQTSLMGRGGHWEILQRCEVEAKRKGDEQK